MEPLIIDLRKAFDTVNHSMLLKKMDHYGIRGIVLDWFSSDLSERKQYVSVNSCISDYLDISFGVPQGSVLGLLLFLIYINDLPNVSKFLSFYLFADDTNIYFEATDFVSLQKIMNQELKYVKKWLHANKRALNIEKTNFVLFHSVVKKITGPIVLKFGCKKITRANHVKFLGVLLDEALAGNSTYLIEVSRKLSRSVGIFYKFRNFVPKEMLTTVYNPLFYPFLSYDIVVWDAIYEKYLKPAFISKKKLMRAITFSGPIAHTSPLFLTFRYLSLKIYIFFTFLFCL